MKPLFAALSSLLLIVACQSENAADQPAIEIDLQSLAKDYLFLELSMGQHDAGHVDAYFGPDDIREAAESAEISLDEIETRAGEMRNLVQHLLGSARDQNDKARLNGLNGRLLALETRIAINKGLTVSFDEESQRLFAAAAPDRNAVYFEAILDDIDTLLGGDGDLSQRVNKFQNQFIIPEQRLSDVFDAAIAECRRRTLIHIALPENESFSIEYVSDKPWSGYNWYQGDAKSLIQINTDLPIFISRAVDLGCHEGYPGHHTFNALLEKNLVQDNGWLEFSLYPLFSPLSLIAEGSGNYGIDLAFPARERIEFEKSVLFPLADLDTTEADRYYELSALLARLNYAGNEAARDYLNGTIDRDQAAQWLVQYALSSPERAQQRIDFVDTYRSYVINYNLGKDLVQQFVERDTNDIGERWSRFERLLSSPMDATDLE